MSKNTAVIERRIRPIYDYLDIGNAKRALQEVEKLLKRQPEFLCARILKALSLIRCSRTPEAEELLKEFEQIDTDDEFILQALTYCYRDLGRPEEIVKFYERALKRQPQNEEFLSHVMMAYCRTGQYKKQNQFAIQLYKLKPNKHYYYFWSVMATVMQAYENPTTKATLMALAEKMAQKSLNERKITAEPEIKLYSMILEMNGKYSEAVALLTGDLNKKLVVSKLDLDIKLINLYERLDRHEEIFNLCKLMLDENQDNWLAWLKLIESGIKLIEANVDLKNSIVDQITQLILTSIGDSSSSENHPTYRGAFLARLKFVQQLLAKDLIPRSELGEPFVLVFEYIRKLGHKLCAFTDVKPFLGLIGESRLDEFIQLLKCLNNGASLFLDLDETKYPESVNAIRVHVCSINIAWYLGTYDKFSGDQRLALIDGLVQHYLNGLKFGTDLPPNDLQYSDDYLLIASYFAWDAFLEKDDPQILINILAALEFAASKSQANFKLKLFLAKIYSFLGCAQCLQELVDCIQIKYIMQETLWYIIADQLTPWGFYENLISWSCSGITFSSQSDKEITDNVIQCYKSGSFDRILEFLAFRQKLRRSLQVRACHVWRRYFNLVINFSTGAEILKLFKDFDPSADYTVHWNDLVDNRDYSVYALNPSSHAVIDDKNSTYLDEIVNELKFYDIITRIFALLFNEKLWSPCQTNCAEEKTSSANDIEQNGISPPSDVRNSPAGCECLTKLDDLIQQLFTHFAHCCQSTSLDDRSANNDDGSPSAARLRNYLNGPTNSTHFYSVYTSGSYFNILYKFLTSTLALLKNVHNCRDGSAGDATTFMDAEEGQTQIKAMFAHHQLREGEKFFPYSQMNHLSFLVQTNSLLLILLNLISVHALGRADCYSDQCNKQQQHSSSGGGDQPQQHKKSKKKKPSCSGQIKEAKFITEDWKLNFYKACLLVFQSIGTTRRIVSDLDLILETNIISMTVNESKSCAEEFASSKQEVCSNIRRSYDTSLIKFSQISHQQALFSSVLCRPDRF